jgi:hypothetical protein
VIRQLRRTAVGLVAAGTMLAGLAACAAPTYTYAADTTDHSYFKVPASWPQVDSHALLGAQGQLGHSLAGPAGGALAWARAYDGAADPSPTALLIGSGSPVVYATVQDLSSTLRSELSFDAMRNLLLPVTPSARQTATAEGLKLSGFVLISSSTITNKDGVRGINELFEYDVGGQPDAFDQTVLTNGSTTKLYLLLVQCYQNCFISHQAQIKTVVNSFTVRGN